MRPAVSLNVLTGGRRDKDGSCLSVQRDLRRVEYGGERDLEMCAFKDRTTPLNKAAKSTKPLFVVQGANDPQVPRSEPEPMVATGKAKRRAGLVPAGEGRGPRLPGRRRTPMSSSMPPCSVSPASPWTALDQNASHANANRVSFPDASVPDPS